MYTKKFPLRVIHSGASEAQANMSKDASLLAALNDASGPILHFYDWLHPAATYGHFIEPSRHIDLGKAQMHGLELARRPTGGGIVFHIWDLAFSFLMPKIHPAYSQNTLDNYRFVNAVVLNAVKEYLSLDQEVLLTPQPVLERGPHCRHFCMARPTIYDVMYRDMKIAGAAQRKTQQGYLHQGTISLARPNVHILRDILRSQEEITEAMERFTFAPLGSLEQPFGCSERLTTARMDLQALLHQKFLQSLKNLS